jgi:hypothetical protein
VLCHVHHTIRLFCCWCELQALVYGDIIQLLHVKSDSFMHIRFNTISETERSACAVRVDHKGRCGAALRSLSCACTFAVVARSLD